MKSPNLLPTGRMVHKVLYNIILPRTGSCNHVYEKDGFAIFHVLKGKKG